MKLHHIIKILLIIAFTNSSLLSAMEIMQKNANFSSLLFKHDGSPSVELKNLLTAYGITATDRTTIVKETQEKFLRKAGTERYQIEGDALTHGSKALFESVELIQSLIPLSQQYDYVLVLGATYKTMENRIHTLIELLQRGLKSNRIAFLGSERALFPHELAMPFDGTENKPKTEHDMMRWLYNKHKDMFAKFGHANPIFINSPNNINEHGQTTRATTQDTIQDFLKANPNPGSCLLISSQPHAHYQRAVVQKEFFSTACKQLNVAAAAAPSDTKEGEVLDALARQIYAENQIYQKIN